MEDQKVIIIRDLSSDEIGLNENFEAKIVRFGLSLSLPPNQYDEALYSKNSMVRIPYRTDPVYEMIGKLKRESDVYSFGVVLFEVLFGRLAGDPIYLTGTDNGVASVARRCFRMGTINEMIDPIIKQENGENTYSSKSGTNKDSLETFIRIAFKCVTETQEQRPTMKQVIKELEKALLLLLIEDNGVQHQDTDYVDSVLEESWKLQFTHENNIFEEGMTQDEREEEEILLSLLLLLLLLFSFFSFCFFSFSSLTFRVAFS
ncbi:hypothetical protein QVD17_39961 [Tagetes erecta]|uniref:Protein kinase domain-containing protein n=1 Tax=Tagetes erecta TaxID=13708 RepID=A0AAD8JRG7_TARER|nr:hypothetical protein QVD17_39961 [Tagetes erecta]